MNIKAQLKHKTEQKNNDKSDTKKKQKVTISKMLSTVTSSKQIDFKRLPTPKKEEVYTLSTKNDYKHTAQSSSNNSNSKGTAGSSVTGSTSKFAMHSVRSSPKSSLADLNCIQLKKVSQERKKKLQLAKNSDKQGIPSSKKVKEQVKKSLAKVIKVYHSEKKSYLDVSMTQISSDGKVRDEKISRMDFSFLEIIGEGGYGKVWKVQHLKTRGIYAMKQMSKALIILKKNVDNVLNELKILLGLRNPFIANMVCAFNDRDNIYLGMDYLPGGDLRSFLAGSQKLKEEDCKFIVACIISALQYIHRNKIFHRDIKPENLVIDEEGYIRLTDFGIARSLKERQSLDSSGTPGYMAPQVMCKQIHSYGTDFYAVGIITYELMMGCRPYGGENRAQIRDAVLSKQHCVKKKDIPAGWSFQSADFINKLILRQPTLRLGNKSGVNDLINHPWMANFPWKDMQGKKLCSPIKKKERLKTRSNRVNQLQEAVNQYKLLQRIEQKVDVFGGYYSNLI